MSQQFEQLQNAMKDLKSEYKMAIYAGIATIFYFVLYLLEWNIFSFILTKLMLGLILIIIRQNVLGVPMKL